MAGQHLDELAILTAYATLADDQAEELSSIAQMLGSGRLSSGTFARLPESGELAAEYATALQGAVAQLCAGRRALAGIGSGLRTVASSYDPQVRDPAAGERIQGEHTQGQHTQGQHTEGQHTQGQHTQGQPGPG